MATDFSQQLPGLAAPVEAPLERLARAQALKQQADSINDSSGLQARVGLAKVALDATELAVKEGTTGALKEEVQGTVDQIHIPGMFTGDAAKARIEENIPKAQVSLLGAQSLQDEAAALGIGAGATGEVAKEVTAMRNEAARYVEAARTGNIGKQEAITRIAASVKKYSAMIPGWAGEFRKVAADLTGISNIDTLGIHAALTQDSAADKLEQRKAEIELQLTKEYMAAHGLTKFEEVTPAGLSYWKQEKSLEQQVKVLENQKKIQGATQEQNDDWNDTVAATVLHKEMAGIASEMMQVQAAFITADTPEEQVAAQQKGAILSAKLESNWVQVEGALRSRMYGERRWSQARAEKFIGDARQSYDRFISGVKNAEGYSLFNNIVKSAKGQSDLLLDKITIAHPFMATLGKFGVAPELAKTWLAAGPDVFRQRFGNHIADAMDKLLKEPEAFATNFNSVAQGTDTLSAMRERGQEDMANASNLSMRQELDKYMEKGVPRLDDNGKRKVSNYLANLGMDGNLSDKAMKDWWMKSLSNPNFSNLMAQLTPEQQANALAPVYQKLDTFYKGSVALLREKVADINKEAGGEVFRVVANPTTGVFVLEQPDPAKLLKLRQGDQQDPALRTLSTMSTSRVTANMANAMNNMKQDVANLNQLLNVTTNTGAAVKKPVDRAVLIGKMEGDINGVTDVPRNRLSPFVIPTSIVPTEPQLGDISPRVGEGKVYPKERDMKGEALDVPPEHPEQWDLEEVTREIARTKSPQLRAILEREKARLEAALGGK